MKKSAFKSIVGNMGLLTKETLADYTNVPLQDKMRFLVDFLFDDDLEFRLLCGLLLRALVMEDFESAWKAMTNRKQKLEFLEKIKLILLDTSKEGIAMMPIVGHMAVIICTHWEILEERIFGFFLDFTNDSLIRSDELVHQRNGLLLTILILPVLINHRSILALIIDGINDIAKDELNEHKNMAMNCILFILSEFKQDTEDFLNENIVNYNTVKFMWSRQNNFPALFHPLFDHIIHPHKICSENVSLMDQSCDRFGVIKTGFENHEFVQMALHSNMCMRGVNIDSTATLLHRLAKHVMVGSRWDGPPKIFIVQACQISIIETPT